MAIYDLENNENSFSIDEKIVDANLKSLNTSGL